MSRNAPATTLPSQWEPDGPQEDLRLIARTLDIVGEAWTLLIVRDALSGTTRFGQFQRHLRLGPNMLAARLRGLVEHGVLEARASTQRADWNDYVLTEKGIRLQTVLAALREWGGDHCVAVRLDHASMHESQ